MREGAVERVINLSQRHAASQAFEDQRDRKARATNCQLSPQEQGVSNDPLIVLVGHRLPVRHNTLIDILARRAPPWLTPLLAGLIEAPEPRDVYEPRPFGGIWGEEIRLEADRWVVFYFLKRLPNGRLSPARSV